MFTHKKLYTNVYNSIIHNRQNLEISQMSSDSEWISKLFCNKKEQLITDG